MKKYSHYMVEKIEIYDSERKTSCKRVACADAWHKFDSIWTP